MFNNNFVSILLCHHNGVFLCIYYIPEDAEISIVRDDSFFISLPIHFPETLYL